MLSSDAAPCARILGETGAGRVFRSNDATDIATHALALTDPAARAALGAAGRAAILGRYNWEYDTATLRHVIDGLGRPGARA